MACLTVTYLKSRRYLLYGSAVIRGRQDNTRFASLIPWIPFAMDSSIERQIDCAFRVIWDSKCYLAANSVVMLVVQDGKLISRYRTFSVMWRILTPTTDYGQSIHDKSREQNYSLIEQDAVLQNAECGIQHTFVRRPLAMHEHQEEMASLNEMPTHVMAPSGVNETWYAWKDDIDHLSFQIRFGMTSTQSSALSDCLREGAMA